MVMKVFGIFCLIFGLFAAACGLLISSIIMIALGILLVVLGLLFFKNSKNRLLPEAKPGIVKEVPAQPAAVVEPSAEPAGDFKTETHHVTGTYNKLAMIMSLLSLNDYYEMTKRELVDEDLIDERIYKYEIYRSSAELVEDPDNPHDPNAVKVFTGGVNVGYIKAGSCSHIKNLIKNGLIEKSIVTIYGGPYKIVFEDDDYTSTKTTYTMEKDETSIRVDLILTVKKK